jgi:hypothetical protein
VRKVLARITARIAVWYAARRPPDFIIGTVDDPYLLRWWVIPRNKRFNIYLHQFCHDDDDRAVHDHPWNNASIVLSAGYIEIVPSDPAVPNGPTVAHARQPGDIVRRRATDPHRIVLRRDVEGRPIRAWSLFLTGPLQRAWGFWCPKGWRHFKKFVEIKIDADGRGVSSIGRGCE